MALSSRSHALVSLYDIDRPEPPTGLVHTFGQPTPILGSCESRLGIAFGEGRSKGGFSMFELGSRAEVVRMDVGLVPVDLRERQPAEIAYWNRAEDDDGVEWEDDVRKIAEDADEMDALSGGAAGSYAERKMAAFDLSGVYKCECLLDSWCLGSSRASAPHTYFPSLTSGTI